MRAAVQINGARHCPAWTALAEEKGIETLWIDDSNMIEVPAFNPDLVVVQYFAQSKDLAAHGWCSLKCPVIGVTADAASITNVDGAFNNLHHVLTALYVDGYDYFDRYRECARKRRLPLQEEKLVFQKFCADTLFPPLELPKEYDWTFIGQVYPAYDVRLKHWRNDVVRDLLTRHPNGFVTGSGWKELLGLDARWIPQTEVNAYYAKSRVVVSIDAHDGAGYTSTRPIESMHAGHCTFLHDHAGMDCLRDKIVHGQHAFYFRTVDEFSELLELVKGDPELARKVGAAGRELVLSAGWTYTGWLRKLVSSRG